MRFSKLLLAALLSGATAIGLYAQTDAAQIAELERAGTTQVDRAAQLKLARLYVSAGRFYEASKIADTLLAIDPNDREAAALRTDAVKGLKQIQDRKIDEADAMARRSDLTDAERLTMADAYFEGGRYRSAAETYAKLPDAMRTHDVKLRQARALAWSGQLDEAERVYAELGANSDDSTLALEYGRLLSWMGASKLAVQRLTPVYQRTGDEETLVALANAQSWSGNREAALQLLNDYIATHPNAGAAVRLRDDIAGGPELRLEKLDRMITVEPFNLALRLERARLLLDAKRYSEALQTVEFIEQHSPRKVEGVAELRDEIERGRAAQIAELKARRAELAERSTSDPEELRSLAQAYVGAADYDSAIRLYEKYLAAHPDDTNARIQYARVLSWSRRYGAAERQYEKLLDENPDRADLRFEYAQVLSYQQEYVPAMRTFRTLTNLSSNPRAHLYTDVPEQAHYNLGQIYRWFGWNEHALAEQRSAVDLDASYSPARTELDLVRHVRPATHFDGTYTYAEDSSDFVMRRYDLEAEKWTSQRTGWDLLVGRHDFERDNADVSANTIAAGARYRWEDRWTGRARLGINSYNEGLGTRPYWALGAEYLPSIQSLFSIDYNHYDLVYDVFTLESLRQRPIDIDDFRAHYDYKTGGHLAYLADASYGFISDDNNRFSAHGLLTYRLTKEPYIAVKGDARYLSYDFRTNRYWSPSDYRSLAGVLQIGSNFRNRLFWQVEGKYGKAYEGDHDSDIRAAEASVTVPINDAFDLVGDYAYGKSGRLDNVFAGGSDEFVNYWQRRFYIGFRMKRLFNGSDRRPGRNLYYFDESRIDNTILPPLGETH